MVHWGNNHTPWYLWPTVGVLAFTATYGFLAARPRDGALWDFGSFHLSGFAASHGFDPYGDDLLSAYASTFHVTLTVPNLNPPVSVPVFELLSEAEPIRAFHVWWWLSLALYGGALAWLISQGPGRKLLRCLWGLSLGGLWMNLALGQIYAPLAALTAVAYHFLEDRPIVAGTCAGLVAAWKPNFLLWAFLLVAARHMHVACTALVVFLAAWTLPLLLMGPHVYQSWIAAAARYQGMHVATNVSVTDWLSSLVPQRAAWTAAAVTMLSCGIYVARRRPSPSFCSDLALALSIAVSPIAWAGYTLLLLPVFLRRLWSVPVAMSAALLVFPANLLWEWSTNHPQDAFGLRLLYPLAVLLLNAGLLYERRKAVAIDAPPPIPMISG
jgi:hypothetical protein